MKKHLLLVAAFALTLGFTACSDDDDPKPETLYLSSIENVENGDEFDITYNADKKIASIKHSYEDFVTKEPQTVTHNFTWVAGQLTKYTASSTDGMNNEYTYSYATNKLTVTDSNGPETVYELNSDGKISQNIVILNPSEPLVEIKQEFKYDGKLNINEYSRAMYIDGVKEENNPMDPPMTIKFKYDAHKPMIASESLPKWFWQTVNNGSKIFMLQYMGYANNVVDVNTVGGGSFGGNSTEIFEYEYNKDFYPVKGYVYLNNNKVHRYNYVYTKL